MLNIAYYLLKVIICSGILYGYYRLALRNKIFHRWNRFYLLAAVIISLSVPLIKINVWRTPSENDGQVIKLLNVVTTGDEMVMEADKNGSFHLSGEQGISILYVLVSLVLLVLLIRSLQRLYNLIRRHQVQRIERINFVDTEAKGTPFSFFRYIFWNHHIDVNSDTGKKIFLHELVHVHEKHSADRLLMNIVLIFFWCNPFFWLIRREMNMIHEFIADIKTVEDSDTGAFAAMILHATYPQQVFGLTSNFFNSSIKRRLLMLTKMKHPRVSYIGRILALPLLTFIFLAFTIKTKTLLPPQGNETIKLEKVFTVVIDAGHGGEDPGAKAADGTTEKSLALAIAQKVKQLNDNSNIRIILSRETDIFQPVRDKVKWTLEQKPDAFISIHINISEEQNTKNSGFDLYVSRQENSLDKQSRLLGSLITKEIAQTYTVAPDLKQRKEKGIWVLDAPDINYPAVLIQCGYINNSKDLAFISNPSNQEKIAKDILRAVERFAKEAENAATGTSSFESSEPRSGGDNKKPAGNADLRNWDAVEKYGEKGRRGVIEIKTKARQAADSSGGGHNIIFHKVEVEASFPGGANALVKYINNTLNKNIDDLKKEGKSGTCLIQFIVDKDGSIREAEALTMKGTKLAEIVINAINNGPKWNPAVQNGIKVTSYRKQPVTFTVANS